MAVYCSSFCSIPVLSNALYSPIYLQHFSRFNLLNFLSFIFYQSDEISALQRCALLHPWYYRYWFSLALAYEKASSSFSGRCKNGELCGVNSTSCFSCASSKYSEHCNSSSDVEEQNECLEHISDDEKKDTSPGAQGDSKTVCCANCSYFKKGKKTNFCYSNSGLDFSERQQPHLVQTFCDCLTANNELKLKWRKHVLSFGCLVKSRFGKKSGNYLNI